MIRLTLKAYRVAKLYKLYLIVLKINIQSLIWIGDFKNGSSDLFITDGQTIFVEKASL